MPAAGPTTTVVERARAHRFAQVYAPPGSDNVSFEPMTAPINPFESDRTQLAEPGSMYRARFAVAVADLER